MTRRPREIDLQHTSSDDRFSAAMLRCGNASGDCSVAGLCIYGDCFASSGEAEAARQIESLLPSADAEGEHVAYLRKAAHLLRNGLIRL